MNKTRRYKLIANPTARRGGAESAISRLLELLNRKGIGHDLELTAGPREAGLIAKAACRDYDVVVAVGGDGTVNEVVQGMAFSDRPLGVIPCGSGNDFVKTLGIPVNVEEAVDILLKNDIRTIDLGRMNGMYFANSVGIGFDAAVAVASRDFRRLKGLPLYVAALVKALGRFRPARMTIELNGEQLRQDVFLLTVGNGTTSGGGFRLTPRAKVDDGLLDVTVVQPMGIPAILRYLPDVFRGTIDRVPYAAMRRTVRLSVQSDHQVPVHVDGEIYSGTEERFEIEVAPKALTVIGNFT